MATIQYVEPRMILIQRTKDSERLYRLEEELHEVVRKVGAEWARVTRQPEAAFFQVQLPQVLFDLLESFDNTASCLAATAYLKAHEE